MRGMWLVLLTFPLWAEPLTRAAAQPKDGEVLKGAVGEELVFSLAGALWTYVGYAEYEGQRVNLPLKRELEPQAVVFRATFPQPGSYSLEFLRQQAQSGELIKRQLRIDVSEGIDAESQAPPAAGTEREEAQATEEQSAAKAADQHAEAGPERLDVEGGSVLGELLKLAQMEGQVSLRLHALWPDEEPDSLALVAEAVRHLPDEGLGEISDDREREFPTLIYRLATILEHEGRDLDWAHRLYHLLAQNYPASPLAAEAAQRGSVLERDFIAVY